VLSTELRERDAREGQGRGQRTQVEPRVLHGTVERDGVGAHRRVPPEEDDVRPRQRRAEEGLLGARKRAAGHGAGDEATGEGNGNRSERAKGHMVRGVYGCPVRKDKVPVGSWCAEGDETKQSGDRRVSHLPCSLDLSREVRFSAAWPYLLSTESRQMSR